MQNVNVTPPGRLVGEPINRNNGNPDGYMETLKKVGQATDYFKWHRELVNCDTAGSFNLRLTNFIAERGGCDTQIESPARVEIEKAVNSIAISYYNMSDWDKTKVVLTSMRNQAGGRYWKEICRKLARFTNRPEREILGLADQEKAALFVRHLARLDLHHPSIVLALALPHYRSVANRVMQLCPDVDAVVQSFRHLRSEMPDILWSFTVWLAAENPDEKQKQAIDAIDEIVDKPVGFDLPFSVGELPPLAQIEAYLLNLHKKNAAEAKPLIASLSQLNPSRPENWLIYGLAGVNLPAQSLHERAWWLAGGLYSWGQDFSKSDKPFSNAAIKDREVVQAIYSDPKLAAARRMIGEYLIRQLVLVEDLPLLLNVLPSDMVRNYPHLLMGLVVREAAALARQKNPDQVKSLIARFPLLQQTGILAIALRRAGQFEAAASELRNCRHEPPGERELLQARIADAFALSLPKNPDEQRRMRDQLEPLLKTDFKADSEIGYCKCLAGLLVGDPVVAERSYLWLRNLVKANCSGRACRLLAAVQSRNPQYIQEALSAVEISEATEPFRSMPTNLLEAGIGALANYPDPTELTGLTDFVSSHAPEMLDPLTVMEDWLTTNPSVRRRWMQKQDAGDALTKWAGYQKVIELADKCSDSDLHDQAIDACLALKDPILAPQQTEMLHQQICICEDMDMREELIQRLIELRPDEAKPHLYQLLQTYMGRQRLRDAARIVALLHDIGEDSQTLRDCTRILKPSQPCTNSTSNGRLPHPVKVGFFGGDENDKPRTEQLRQDLMRDHPGLTVEFDCRGWNTKNLDRLVTSVDSCDVIVASNLMRTTVNRRLRKRARESGKTFGFCRNRGNGTIAESILKAVNLHLAHKAANGRHKSNN